MPRTQLQRLKFPLKGLYRSAAFQDGQGPYTTYDALNVRPEDTILSRDRGGSRPGLDTLYSTQLGSGNPVNLLDTVTYIATDGLTDFIDNFPGTTIDSAWNQIGSLALPSVTDNLVNISYTANGYAALDLISNFDTSQAYTIGMFIVPYNGAHHGDYYLYGMMDDTTPVPTTDGFVAKITMTGTNGVATADLDSYASSVKTDVDTGTGTGTYAKAGWFIVTVSGTTVTMFWDGEQLATGTISGLSGTRVGFGVECTESGGVCLIDSFRHQYVQSSPVNNDRNILLAGSNGTLYKNSTANTMVSIGATLKVSTDDYIQCAERAQKLYIADYGLAQAGTDGTISGTTFDDVAGTDWSTIGANANDYVVVLSSVTGSTVAGNYAISSIAAGSITLASAPGDGTATYRIERGAKIYDPSDDSVTLWTATSGKGTFPQGNPLITRYRDRLAVAGGDNAPHVWYMSRQGDPLDWDYSQEDPATAVAGTNADAGTIGEPILALVSHSDDYLLFGCQNSLWVLRGDPAFGGQIDNLSENIGIVDKKAWCYGPNGEIVFLSRDGIYVLNAGAQQYPQSVSRELLPKELRDIDRNQFEVTMAYDIRDRGVHLYLSSANAQTVSHWWFDWEEKSFWPVTLQAGFDPTSLLEYYSNDLKRSVVVLGGRDGYLRYYDEFFETDGGNEITSYVMLGPIRLGGSTLKEGKISELVATLGANSGDVTWELIVGETAEAVSTNSAFDTGTWIAGTNYNNHPRGRGNAYAVKISNAETQRWALEESYATIQEAGKFRKG